jgi:DNA (cytosine-5)-methyltransferase 1
MSSSPALEPIFSIYKKSVDKKKEKYYFMGRGRTMLNGLDLFSGIGGLSYALRQWITPKVYCEIEPYCQGVLLSRMEDGEIPTAPIWDDVATLDAETFNLRDIDIIYGGFPCQDISIAGLGAGLEGKRSGLFFEIIRLAKEIKPKFLFLENVPAITGRGGIRVVREITEMGYDCRWCVISAASVGASHKRKRWFLLANTKSGPTLRLSKREKARQPLPSMSNEYSRENEWKEAVSSMGKFTDGISHRLDRLKALGNAVVPQQARKAFQILSGLTR